ncbi:MAG: kinase [Alphaproteobacteria bacterium]|nr:kinase [Alphaproteobacteria bacterium]
MNGHRSSAPDLTRSFTDRVHALWRRLQRPVIVGLCGAQGSGKSTLAQASREHLESLGVRSAIVSLDDFYLPQAERMKLSTCIHPLLITRGVPGTHDTDLLASCLDQLVQPGYCDLPRFDKAHDTRANEVTRVQTPVEVVLFEGWCVGARPQPSSDLVTPINRLEAEEDPNCTWRNFVQSQLAGPYQNLFASIDALALLEAPDFAIVFEWRREQEMALRRQTGAGMSDAQLIRFIAHFERLTRWILLEMPARADWCFRLDAHRHWLTD